MCDFLCYWIKSERIFTDLGATHTTNGVISNIKMLIAFRQVFKLHDLFILLVN